MKVLIVYYSRMGHSKKVAELLKEHLNADVEEIQMVEPYPDDEKPHYLLRGYEAMVGSKPPIKPLGINPTEYDLVVIGSPTWNWRISPPIYSFISKYPLKDKKVALYVSAGGDGVKCIRRFKSKMKGTEIV
ncbi:MAG: flavodoxin family protein, partial [Promethearchaeota archaeon]